MDERLGMVTAVSESEATVAWVDGSVSVVSIPEMLQVDVGMPVTKIDTGDGKPIYAWGTEPPPR